MPATPMATIERELAAGKILVLDGATGTELERRGAAMQSEVWSAMATLTHPKVLRGVHEDYIRAGARVITANTFSSSRNMLGPAGLGDRFAELNHRAVEIALEARDRMGANDTVAVAGSMSHQVPLAVGTGSRDVSRIPPADEVAESHREMATTLADAGVDLILLEMMSDPALANPAVAAARSTGRPVWIGYSCRADAQGAPVSYTIETLGVSEMLRQIAPDDAGAIGIMHTNVGLLNSSISTMRDQFQGPIMAYPDSGYFKMPHWQWVDIISPQDLAAAAPEWIDAGAQLVGGCCGLGVEHIDALANSVARR